MARQKASTEERQRRREEQRARLARATEDLLTSEGWRRWLRARAPFHTYSLRNTLLIALQAEERGFTATYVAGFRAWLSLDRCVRKGERGLRILAPMSVKEVEEKTGEEVRRTFFREAAVFDTLSRDCRVRAERRLRGVRQTTRHGAGRLGGAAPEGPWSQADAVSPTGVGRTRR